MDPVASPEVIETDIPARLDRLPWIRWHWRVVFALGVTWVLDGLEVTIVGALGAALESPLALGLGPEQIGLSASAYLVGAIAGALVFGHLTDRLGRKRLFLVTLAIYVAATLLTAVAWSFHSFALFRLLTGAAIGGEYAAMNSAIDELLPARVRGFVDLAINGSFWLGTAAGALASIVLLDARWFPPWLGWRLGFGLGGLLAFAVILVRRHVPESPRWLILHGRAREAEAIVASVEAEALEEARLASPPGTEPALAPPSRRLRIVPGRRTGITGVLRVLASPGYRPRAVLALALMAAQAFFYNAIFFTYALVLARYFGVPSGDVGKYLLPFAAGNFLGPLLLGRLFDRVGRRAMIVVTYAASGLLLLLTGALFAWGHISVETQTALWCVTFFFGSAAASSAYLTVSEIFPVEVRAMAIAVFYAFGTAIGGALAPAFFAALIGTGARERVFVGYAVGAGLMLLAALTAAFLAVKAERRALEDVARPLSEER